jgi:hypothetical protein
MPVPPQELRSAPEGDQALVTALSSSDPAERAKGAECLGKLRPEQVLDLVRYEAYQYGRRRRVVRKLLIGAAVLYVAVPVLSFIARSSALLAYIYGLPLLLTPIVVGVFGRHRRFVRSLARYDDVRVVGPLVEALEMDESISVVEDQLTKYLPHLRANDGVLLNVAQRRMLDRALLRCRKPDLVLAILTAFRQIGDAKSLTAVEKLANGQSRTSSNRRVQQAAIDCVPYLQLRAQTEHDAQTLLRPVYSADPEGTLLRPAHGPGDADPQVLLRPAAEPESER